MLCVLLLFHRTITVVIRVIFYLISSMYVYTCMYNPRKESLADCFLHSSFIVSSIGEHFDALSTYGNSQRNQ